MIRTHPGWHRHILRNWGGMTNYLYNYLTRSPASKICDGFERNGFFWLPARKQQCWYRNPQVAKRSFRAQEQYVFLQIALVIFHRTIQPHLTGEWRLFTPDYAFPCIGFTRTDTAYLFCDRLSNQNTERFLELVDEATRELPQAIVRWFQPVAESVSVKLLRDRDQNLWPKVHAADFQVLAQPHLEGRFFRFDVTELYLELKAS